MQKKYLRVLQFLVVGIYFTALFGAVWGRNPTAYIPLILLLIPLGLYHLSLFREYKTRNNASSQILWILLSDWKRLLQTINDRLQDLSPEEALRGQLKELSHRMEEVKKEADKEGTAEKLEKIRSFTTELLRIMERLLEFLTPQLSQSTKLAQESSTIKTELQGLCSIHLPVDVTDKWKDIATGRWDSVSANTLESLSQIKEVEDSNVRFVQEVITQFNKQQVSYENYTESYQESLQQYFSKVEGIRGAYERDLNASTQEVQNAFAQFQQITDIVGRIKLISLNMSIEASKVKGSGAFGLLARELRRLAEHTEDTLKQISQRIQTTLEQVEANKVKQIQEFASIFGIVDHFKEISSKYDKTTTELTEYIQRAIHKIEDNQKEARNMLMRFFQNLQNLAIYKEELLHMIQYQKAFLEQVNGIVQRVVRDLQLCRGAACPDRREALELLASIVTTDEERQFVNELFKEYLGIDREESHGRLTESKEGVVLF